MTRRRIAIAICLLVLMAMSACSGSDDTNGASEPEGGGDAPAEVADYETDVDALREIYPLGDLEVESVRWRYHTDFAASSDGARVLDDLPAQDADPILEAVFVFDDEAVRQAALAGRTTTVSELPAWYPDELTGGEELSVAVATSPVDGLPGEVSAFPDAAPYVVVRYQP